MLIVELKSKDDIEPLCNGSIFALCCLGCSEVYFPEICVNKMCEDLAINNNGFTIAKINFICNYDNTLLQLDKYSDMIRHCDTMLVFSCGVGIQTVANLFPDKRIVVGCDTFPLPGFQGVTPLEYNCIGCGECHLNSTYGICPITSCSKSLVNGQCGGSKNGMCEADDTMECGWERIYKRSRGEVFDPLRR